MENKSTPDDYAWRFDWLLRPGSDSVTQPLTHTAIINALRERLPRVDVGSRVPRQQYNNIASPADDALSEDVRLLGSLLGWVLVEHAGIDFYRAIEGLRQATRRARREPGGPDWAELDSIISSALEGKTAETSLTWLADAAGAFHLFLTLCNIAEGLHFRGQELDSSLAHLARIAPTPEALDNITVSDVRLVATAHPTKIVRQRILAHREDLYFLLKQLRRNKDMTAVGQIEVLERLTEKIEVLWATQFSRWERPQVSDEIDHTLTFFTRTIYNALANFHQRLEHLYWFRTGHLLPEPHRPRLTLGSWVGSDMDGNPYVTPDVFAEALEKQHRAVIKKYAEELRAIAPRFSHAVYRVPLTEELSASIDRDVAQLKGTSMAIRSPERIRNREPYRLKLRMMAERLSQRTEHELLDPEQELPPFAYRSVQELIADLELVSAGLKAAGYHRSVDQDLAALRRKVDIYGFHAASLDLREDSEVFRTAAAALLKQSSTDWALLDGSARVKLIAEHTLLDGGLEAASLTTPAELTEEYREHVGVVRLLEMLALAERAQRVIGEPSVKNLIVTMTSAPEDVLAGLLLLKSQGLFSISQGKAQSRMDVVPLFETIADLQRAPQIMEALFSNPAYKTQLEARSQHQLIMLGYSDSSKDGGYFASNWCIYRAQVELLEVADRHNVKVRFFHGRGGSIGRGGGPTMRAVMALPPRSSRHGHDLTEQGEVLARHYAIDDIAEQHFESTVAALWTKRLTHTTTPEAVWVKAAERISELSRSAYSALIHENPDFIPYFEQITPKEVELVKIGSRPTKRRLAQSVRDLRAIPWVFRWFQSRQILPGWFGFGSALEQFVAIDNERQLELLRTMYAGWPFFRSVLSNSEIALRQTDLNIARYYVRQLATPLAPAQAILDAIETEYHRTCRELQRITGHGLLGRQEDRPLDRSIDLKEPYLDPLNYIQVRLLLDYRKRAASDTGEEMLELYERAIVSSIEGIATGLGTTG